MKRHATYILAQCARLRPVKLSIEAILEIQDCWEFVPEYAYDCRDPGLIPAELRDVNPVVYADTGTLYVYAHDGRQYRFFMLTRRLPLTPPAA